MTLRAPPRLTAVAAVFVALTLAGLLALPSYGGNENKAGWKLVGFVDQHAWQPPFGHYDVGYPGFSIDPTEAHS